MKKIISILLITTILLGLFALAPLSASALTAGNYQYDVNDDGSVTITGYTGKEKSLTIPSTLDERSVSRIGRYSFLRATSLSNVKIPDSVKVIEEGAFLSCSSMKSVTIPDSVTNIGARAFESTGLTKVVIPDSVKKVGASAFKNCSGLTSVMLSDSMTAISNEVFFGCRSLPAITIPNSVTSIGKKAFQVCPSLTSVKLSGSLKSIGELAFHTCRSLTKVKIPKSVTKIGKMAFGFYWESNTKDKSFNIQGKSGTAAEKYARDNGLLFNGKTATLATPKISKLQNVVGGVKITVKKVKGAAKYRIFRKTTGSWKKLKDTTKLTYTDKAVKSGTKYAYTVRCISKDGKKNTSSYNKTGKSIKYIAAPANPTLKRTSAGVKATWKKVKGAVKYRLLRKTSGSSWKKIGDTKKLTYTDKTAKKGKTYYYTVRCVSADGKKATSAYRSGRKISIPKAKTSTAAKKKTNTNTNTNTGSSSGSGADKLKKYIKAHGSRNNDGLLYIGGRNTKSSSENDYNFILIQSDGLLKFIDDYGNSYSSCRTQIYNINQTTGTAKFTVKITYGVSETAVYASGSIKLKSLNGTNSALRRATSIGTLKFGSTYSKIEAKNTVYSCLGNCLRSVDLYLKNNVGMSTRNLGIVSGA